MALERTQNPVVGSEVNLRLFTYNSNNRKNISAIDKVEIFFLDPTERTETNPDGRRLVETFSASDVTSPETGQYVLTITAQSPLYTIGRYLDAWTVSVEDDAPLATIYNGFEIIPSLWYTTPLPIVYDFAFRFSPNRLRQGSKRYLIIDITPNVPRGSDLERYYTNLAIASPVKISIEKACVECLPEEEDLRLMVDCAAIEYKEKCKAFYFIDTTDYDLGIYNVWFSMDFGESTYISDKQQLQIF